MNFHRGIRRGSDPTPDAGTIQEASIADGAVSARALAAGAVTGEKIASGTIDETDLADNCVGPKKININARLLRLARVAIPTDLIGSAVATRTDNEITASSNGSINSSALFDGVTDLALNDRVLHWKGTGSTLDDNGLYYVSQIGDGGSPWKLMRAADARVEENFPSGTFVLIEDGTTYATMLFQNVTDPGFTVNTDAISIQPVTARVPDESISAYKFSRPRSDGYSPLLVLRVPFTATGAAEVDLNFENGYPGALTRTRVEYDILECKVIVSAAAGSETATLRNKTDGVSLSDAIDVGTTGTKRSNHTASPSVPANKQLSLLRSANTVAGVAVIYMIPAE